MSRLFIRASKQGQIVAVLKVDALPLGVSSPFADNDQSVVVIEVGAADMESVAELEPLQIHEGYEVDTKKKLLKRKKVS